MLLRLVTLALVYSVVIQDAHSRPKDDSKIDNKIHRGHSTKRPFVELVPFQLPPPEEIERLAREDGFFLAVVSKALQIIFMILSAPFRNCYKVIEFVIMTVKLAVECARNLRAKMKIS